MRDLDRPRVTGAVAGADAASGTADAAAVVSANRRRRGRRLAILRTG